jgi:hypothetical protein
MRDVLQLAGALFAIFLAAAAIVALLLIPISHFEANGCERIGQIQKVETVYHWTTGCVYVNPDYVVTK